MFKYLRTLNTEFHPTTVEFVVSQKHDGLCDYVNAGMIVNIENGKIANFFTPDKPMYLALTAKYEDEEKAVKCIRLSSGMVLEADIDISANMGKILNGALVCVAEHVDSKAEKIADGGTPSFEVLDSTNKERNKATVVVL